MKIISFDDIANLNIAYETFYDWVVEMLLKKHTTVLPPKISLKQGEHCFFNIMPSIISESNIMGTKHVMRYPNNSPALSSQILLYRQSDGELLALMDGTYITAMRTGAVAAHSVKTFAKKGFNSIGFAGLGNTVRATMSVLASVIDDTPYNIGLLRYKDHAELFIERFSGYKNLSFTIFDNIKDLIMENDVVVSGITYTDDLLADDSCYKTGCTIIPIHTRGFQNCDLFFDKIFTDDSGQISGFMNFDKFQSLAETCEVVMGLKPGRESDSERILIYNIGVSIHDIFFANKIYSMFTEKNETVNLGTPKEKTWV